MILRRGRSKTVQIRYAGAYGQGPQTSSVAIIAHFSLLLEKNHGWILTKICRNRLHEKDILSSSNITWKKFFSPCESRISLQNAWFHTHIFMPLNMFECYTCSCRGLMSSTPKFPHCSNKSNVRGPQGMEARALIARPLLYQLR